MELIQHPHWLGDKNVDFDYLYLPLALKSAILSNPGLNVIYVNANDSNLNIKGVTELPLASVNDDLDKLSEYYLHLSPNQYLFELHSIQRHFVLRNTMRKLSIQSTFVSEGDVLLLRSFQSVLGKDLPIDIDALLTDKNCVSTGWVTLEYVEFYCDLVMKVYSTENLKQGIAKIYQDMQDNNKQGGICDMTFCHFINIEAYGFKNQLKIGDICAPFHESGQKLIFDNFLPRLDIGGLRLKAGLCNYKKQQIKQLTIDDGIVLAETIDGEYVEMASLHFQGQSKRLISYYFSNALC